MPIFQIPRHRLVLAAIFFVAAFVPSSQAGDKPLTFADLMKFRTIRDPVISEDGGWIAYGLKPDRGDGEAVVRSSGNDAEYRIERGAKPRVSGDGRWAAATIEPSLEELEKSKKNGKNDKDKPKNGLALVDLADGSETRIEKVDSFAFSDDGRWLAYHRVREKDDDAKEGDSEEEEPAKEPPAEEPPAEEPEEKPAAEEEQKGEKEKEKKKDEKLGSPLVLRELATGQEITLEHVSAYGFDKPSAFLAYTVSAPEGAGNGVFVRELAQDATPLTVLRRQEKARYTHLSWAEGRRGHRLSLLAFVEEPVDDEDEAGDAAVWIWEGRGEARRAASRDDAPEGWTVPAENELRWSRDGQRLFFGFKPDDEKAEDEDGENGEAFDPYDLDALLEKREVAVWHWNDPLIQSHQKEQWKEEKKRTYRAVFHRESGRVVALADRELRHVEVPENPRRALGRADTPYLREITWNGPFADLYVVDLESAERRLVIEKLRGNFAASLSPGGRYVVYFYNDDDGDPSNGHWHLYDTETRETRNLTAGLDVSFADEDHDYPYPASGYALGEWLRDDSAILISDKYDVWRFPTRGVEALPITGGQGRAESYRFSVVDLDPDEEALDPSAPLLLLGYHDRLKHMGFYTAPSARPGVVRLRESGQHRFRVLAKAGEADRVLYTRESYDEFPDLWTASLEVSGGRLELAGPRRLSAVNPQIAEFAWGEPELVEWNSLDGIPLQGVLIKPGNYEPGKRYPVLVYYYRFFSQRLHEFNEPVVNHRPSFPLYASNGYAVFLPDIRFDVGRPGFSATKCLVPGVQKLIDMGVADPGAIGLHGHSWSGYQTAYVITQTHIFRAAVAGAPVSNMTSAYSGIRWGSGLARQFQYEQSQSRIGGSLWEYPERYIENSPVFFADRIETPLLIQFGDEDGAVPWYQGIELYLAMRRLGKECVFLQYRGEPHHLQKYANKLDYSIKMKEFFDHHLKGAPAPAWMEEGEPYRGD